MTFTVTDALLSETGLAVLSGAGVFKAADTSTTKVHVHKTGIASLVKGSDGVYTIDLAEILDDGESVDVTAPVTVQKANGDGSIAGNLFTGFSGAEPITTSGTDYTKLTSSAVKLDGANYTDSNAVSVFVDFYTPKLAKNVSEIQIKAEDFGGSYYVEAYTLFRDQETGADHPALITFPNAKIQSNFTFNMSSTGDPSKPNCLAA